ncbi:MAG TPA: methionine synthase [Acidimicrobiia bacterium]|nr:methionine synthase [Acidimicrobiia bacterium]
MRDFLDAVAEGVVLYDGGTGTALQRANLTVDDFGGPELEGCNEVLNVTRPDVVAGLHATYFDAGADVVETNTFGAFGVPLAEYGIAERAHELALAAATIAAGVAADYRTPERPRWVAGSIGPGTKMPSLGQITYRDLAASYEPLARGLLEGGVDLFIVETMYDLLGLKAAVTACRRAMETVGRRVPLQVQVTIEQTGRMLPGTEIGAALAAIDPLRPDVIGLNCATGPDEMEEHVRHLSRHSRVPISVIPNAGLPEVRDGDMYYGLTPAQLAAHLSRFITEYGVRVIGGCCGTSDAHIAELDRTCRDLTPAARAPEHVPGATSLYSHVPFEQDTSFLIVGERTNANGSKQFREAMLAEDWDACLAVARSQVAESAHLIDVCVDYVGRDGAADMREIVSRFAGQVPVPLVLDSTEPEVMEAGLELIGGRSVLNSANLEDGDAPGSRLDRVFRLAREHGAAVICLLIDEEGQARDVEWKLRVAHRIHDLAVHRYGLEPGDLIFDCLTVPLTTGDEDLRKDGLATIEAIRRIKSELPGVFTVLGVSNVSFGVGAAARHVLNSVFLHECVEAGLDAAIVHAGRIMPLSRIDDAHRTICLDLINDRRSDGYDPLESLLEAFTGVSATAAVTEDRSGWPVDRRLSQRIVDGDLTGLTDDLDEALVAGMPALEIVNDVLLSGMKTVGELFASGEMQLPFVLRSAETMKAAVAHLEPHMDRVERADRGSIVLATVKGDVHDIGKNLVDIILTNNGFTVHNLGIKVGIADMVEALRETGADALGMSGLLVKSTLVMGDNLDELRRLGLEDTPVILGGAALTRSFVERDLRERYPGPLFYGKDAFAGLAVMQELAERRNSDTTPGDGFGRQPTRRLPERSARPSPTGEAPARSPEVVTDNRVFTPPFLGSRVVKGIGLDEIAEYVNLTALFRNQWQFRPESGEDDAHFKDRLRPLLAEQLAHARRDGVLVPQVVYGYFPANGDGNDLVIWTDESRSEERMRFGFPRQAADPWLCIADFFRPADGPDVDVAAFHIVTMGAEVSARAQELFAADRYSDYLLLHGLGVEMAEALAELWHRRIRVEWGFGDEDGPTLHGLFRQQYRGGRYSWGYPACPDLEDNEKVADLLGAGRIGVTVGEETSFQYEPEQTTSAIICHHPRAKYFIARGG